MGCETRKTEIKEWQDLSGWNGHTLRELKEKLNGRTCDEVRIYTVKTTKFDRKSNEVHHEGSGPNLEGGLATLCTCKHSMRQNHVPHDWKGRWILGLTSRAAKQDFSGKHYLFYMMKVDEAFNSHKELYSYLKLKNENALRVKNAGGNCLGDIFEPRATCTNSLDPNMYKTPNKNHSHGYKAGESWCDDIVYKGQSAPLLLGDAKNTFVWPNPMIIFKKSRGPNNLKLSLGEDFFNLLETSK